MGFPRQEHWSGLPFSSREDLSDPGTKPASPSLQVDSFITEPLPKPMLLGKISVIVLILPLVGCLPGGWALIVPCISAPPTHLVWSFLYTFCCGKSFLLVFRSFSR